MRRTCSKYKSTHPSIYLPSALRALLTLSFGISQIVCFLLPHVPPCNARSKCRLLREPVSYVRNRSLPLVPPDVARSQRKHIRVHGAVERGRRRARFEGVAALPLAIRYLCRECTRVPVDVRRQLFTVVQITGGGGTMYTGRGTFHLAFLNVHEVRYTTDLVPR